MPHSQRTRRRPSQPFHTMIVACLGLIVTWAVASSPDSTSLPMQPTQPTPEHRELDALTSLTLELLDDHRNAMMDWHNDVLDAARIELRAHARQSIAAVISNQAYSADNGLKRDIDADTSRLAIEIRSSAIAANERDATMEDKYIAVRALNSLQGSRIRLENERSTSWRAKSDELLFLNSKLEEVLQSSFEAQIDARKQALKTYRNAIQFITLQIAESFKDSDQHEINTAIERAGDELRSSVTTIRTAIEDELRKFIAEHADVDHYSFRQAPVKSLGAEQVPTSEQ